MLAWLLAVAFVGQIDNDDAAKQQILELIADGSYKRIAVCPQPVCLEADQESFASASTGPQGAVWCSDMVKYLADRADKHGFAMVTERSVKAGMKGVTLDTLADQAELERINKKIGADGLVLMEVTPDGDGFQMVPRLIDLKNNTEKVAETESLDLTLSDLAFMGNSFEARRWKNGKFELVGFDPDVDSELALGMGYNYEIVQAELLNREQEHPLLADEADAAPYGFKIVVNGSERELDLVGKDLYVKLDPNETFGIQLYNNGEQPILAAVYIDGVNTIERTFQHPLDTPAEKRWSLAPGYNGVVRGWFMGTSTTAQQFERFKIVPREESVAFGESVDGKFGMITVAFYTNGTDGINVPEGDLKSKGASKFGVGREAAESVTLQFEGARPGLMLAAMTINYRTTEELEQLKYEAGKQETKEDDSKKPDLTKVDTGSDTDSGKKPIVEDLTNGEDVPFTSVKKK